MPALLRYFSELIHFKTSNPNPIPLHGNPVLDNFVFKHAAVQTGRTFATAHSCGLRRGIDGVNYNAAIFASAHSRGLRLCIAVLRGLQHRLCHSAFVRVATFQRVHVADNVDSLPQRIRAGCDSTFKIRCQESILCHSAFVRVATVTCLRIGDCLILCHSAFVRVATSICVVQQGKRLLCHSAFVRVATQ